MQPRAASTGANDSFADFRKKQAALLSLIQRQRAVLRALGMSTWEEKLHPLEERVRSESFRVMVLGEFNRGKSTFINAMLGEKVLPAYYVPTTAIINEVKWGDQRKARLHFLPPKTEPGSHQLRCQFRTLNTMSSSRRIALRTTLAVLSTSAPTRNWSFSGR